MNASDCPEERKSERNSDPQPVLAIGIGEPHAALSRALHRTFTPYRHLGAEAERHVRRLRRGGSRPAVEQLRAADLAVLGAADRPSALHQVLQIAAGGDP